MSYDAEIFVYIAMTLNNKNIYSHTIPCTGNISKE